MGLINEMISCVIKPLFAVFIIVLLIVTVVPFLVIRDSMRKAG